MPDFRLQWDPQRGVADLLKQANDLASESGLTTSIILSLYLDRRHEGQRGWWGDEFAKVEGDQTGSHLWLYEREPESDASLRKREQTARAALAWLLEDSVAERVDVIASRPEQGMWALELTFYRPGKDPARYRFDHVWNGQADAS